MNKLLSKFSSSSFELAAIFAAAYLGARLSLGWSDPLNRVDWFVVCLLVISVFIKPFLNE